MSESSGARCREQGASNPYDPRAWSRQRAELRPRLKFDATDAPAVAAWQRELREVFARRLGGLPAERAPLEPRILAREALDGYVRETLEFTSRPGLCVFGYFLLPGTAPGSSGAVSPGESANNAAGVVVQGESTNNAAGAVASGEPVKEPDGADPARRPTLLCLHGHGYGVDALVGLDERGEPRSQPDYHHDFALQAVRRGYAVLAIEILGFGRRREDSTANPGDSSCQTLSGTALMLGETMAGWRVYDTMRALDYLETRAEVDMTRVGTMGISGGGLNALFLAALDLRVRAAVVSGYLNTFQDSVMSVSHCIDNFIPGLRLDAEMSDIAGLVAPRALWCENGTLDPIFPVAAFERALDEVKRVYAVMGVPDRVGGEVFEGDHQFYGRGAWPFLRKHLDSTSVG